MLRTLGTFPLEGRLCALWNVLSIRLVAIWEFIGLTLKSERTVSHIGWYDEDQPKRG